MLNVIAMADWLTRISLSCFALSYLIALLLEISRLFYRVSVRSIVIFTMMLAGIFAHIIFLWDKFQSDFSGGTPLASWYDWCLVISLALSITYTIGPNPKNHTEHIFAIAGKLSMSKRTPWHACWKPTPPLN